MGYNELMMNTFQVPLLFEDGPDIAEPFRRSHVLRSSVKTVFCVQEGSRMRAAILGWQPLRKEEVVQKSHRQRWHVLLLDSGSLRGG